MNGRHPHDAGGAAGRSAPYDMSISPIRWLCTYVTDREREATRARGRRALVGLCLAYRYVWRDDLSDTFDVSASVDVCGTPVSVSRTCYCSVFPTRSKDVFTRFESQKRAFRNICERSDRRSLTLSTQYSLTRRTQTPALRTRS